MRILRISSTAGAILIGLGGVLLGAALTGAGGGETATLGIQGGGYAGKVREPDFAFTYNNPANRLSVTISRELFKVPEEYGEPFAVTVENSQTMVWYRHPELGVRNVILEKDRQLVHILPRSPLKSEAPPEGAR